ncbi:hypothetical protein [Chitinophaga rhizophila]|nr:hypothetical protein [Chitinophaga rhizophila]
MFSRLKKIPVPYVITVGFALFLRLLFEISMLSAVFSVMTISFFVLTPFAMGALTIYFSDIEDVKSLQFRITHPWRSVFIFMLATTALAIEGFLCWVMILPLFMLGSSIGALITGYFKLRGHPHNRIFVSLLTLLPLLITPLEKQLTRSPAVYKVYTYVDIQAAKETVWSHATSVSEISPAEHTGWLTNIIGIPRPVKAELNYAGIGAYRKGVFEGGLTFDETVTDYEPGRKMTFTIKANPYDIPASTMDEHIVIGGQYFDVLNSTFELEQMDNNIQRLHLYSNFQLTTTFNTYASWWAGWIMKDIQDNILHIIKGRAEHGNQI